MRHMLHGKWYKHDDYSSADVTVKAAIMNSGRCMWSMLQC